MTTWLPVAAILVPLTTALLVPVLDLISVRLRAGLCLAGAALTVACLVGMAPAVLDGEVLVYWMSGWTPRDGVALGISLVVDAWALLIAGLVAVVGLMSLVYALVYLRHETGRAAYYVLFMLLIAALVGFALSGDLFNQFVWLEVFSVAAFALTGYHYEERGAIEAAFKYLITNSIAALFIATALCLLYMQTGALNLAHIARQLPQSTASLAAVGLLVAGYATKAALVPWHFWLPDAHAAAPGPVSAMFSGALIKVGIYALARNLFTLAPALMHGMLATTLLIVAAASILIGGAQMLQQESVKRILAYSSVAQMGYALLGLAVGTPLGLAAAAAHLIHHALVKTPLFMAAGLLAQREHVHSLADGGGLARRMPVTTVLFSLGALSLSGMPFFSGFISKTMLEEAALHEGLWLAAAVAVLGSLLTFAGMARLTWRVFFAAEAEHARHRTQREFPFAALLPMGLLVAGSVAMGIAPQQPIPGLAWPAARSLAEAETYASTVLNDVAADSPEHAWHAEPAPNPLDWRHWWAPAIGAAGGGSLAYWLAVRGRRQTMTANAATQIGQAIASVLRRWHSGVVNDYALWGAVGTTMLVWILIAGWIGR
jgi:multicomponent Na+:H+ antiporter subunit D